MKIKKNILELVGNTPLLELTNFEKKYCTKGKIIAKLESFNPAGSAKDRVGKTLLEEAEQKGLIKKGSVIIEPTSGNTGIGLAVACIVKGYKLILTMPETMSVERRMLLSAYGAQIVLTEGNKGMAGAIEKANEIAASTPGSYIPGQFVNFSNPLAHYNTTGPEIWKDTDGNVDVLVASIGTGGTLSGTAKYLKEQNRNIKIIGIEPASSAVLSGGKAGSHKIQGIGAGFVPEILDTDIIDEIIPVTDEDAYKYTNELVKLEGLLCGISSGSSVCGALKIAEREEYKGKNIVCILPDTGERYLSAGVFN